MVVYQLTPILKVNSILYYNQEEMKKLIIIISLMSVLFSCEKESCREEIMEPVTLTYTVGTPVEIQIKSADGEGDEINALWYGVYHKKENGTYVYMSDMSAYVPVTDASAKISVPIVLFKDQEYKIIFVAQYVSGNTYTYLVDENGNLTLNENAIITNGEQLDAFVYWEETGKITNDFRKEIELTRPLAQINFTTTASEKPEKVSIKVNGVCDTYKVFEKIYSPQTGTIEVEGLQCSEENLGTIYFLTGPYQVDVEMRLKYSNGTEVTKTVPNVSVAPNYKTNIKGNI